jgi:NADH-quinone oxidoreductase subunit L
MAMVISASCGILGIILAVFLYVVRPALADSLKTSAGPLYTLVSNKYYVDEFYSGVIVAPLRAVSRSILWRGVDQALIDSSFVNGLGRVIRGWGALLRHLQSGSIRNYATWVLAGALLMVFILSFTGGGR